MKKKILSLLLVMVLVLSFLPAAALADNELVLTSENCVQIGEDKNEYPIYLYDKEIPEGAETVVFAAVSEAMGEDGMIFPWPGNEVVYGDSAPLTDFYAFDFEAADQASEIYLQDAYADYDFSNCYGYWLMDEGYDSYYYIIKMPAPEAPPFTASVGEIVGFTDGAYADPYSGSTAGLYVVEVPFGTETVTLDFGGEYRLAYNYDEAGYVAGEYDDINTGVVTATVAVDANSDGRPDYIQVQTPYDAEWNNTLLYAVVFAYPFTVSVSGTVLTACEVKGNSYQYTDWTGTDQFCSLYTYEIPAGTETVEVSFPQSRLCYNYSATGSDPYVADEYLAGEIENYTSGQYVFTCSVDSNGDGVLDFLQIQSPYDAVWNSTLLYAIMFRYPAPPFTASAGGAELTGITQTAGGYTPYEYDYASEAMVPGSPVTLYTVSVPEGTESVDLAFPENVLAYNYTADGSSWIAGEYEDATAGAATATVPVDGNGDGEPDCIQVQTPYDESWNSTVLYAVTFRYPAPFTASAGGKDLTEISAKQAGYTPYEYDYASETMVPGSPVTLYTVSVPEGTESIDLAFPENVLAYNYTADGSSWIAGEYEDATAGAATATVPVDGNGDGEPDCIQVQTPYDESWNSTVLYAITFSGAGSSGGDEEPVTEADLLHGIASAYAQNGLGADSNTAWAAADMMTYASLADAQYALSAAQKEVVKDDAIQTLFGSPTASEAAKSVIALAAMGCDPAQLTAADGTPFSAKDVLDALAFTEDGEAYNEPYYEYTLPYVIMAYRLLDDAEALQKLTALALEIQSAWMDTTWGVDGMTPFMVALAPDYASDAGVKAALDTAAEAVRAAQLEDGSIASYYGGSAASTGLAIAGFTALGQDPHEIKNGENSLIDGLLGFAVNEGTSLGSALDTEQGFRGLVAAAKGAGFVTYTFDTSALAPAADLSLPCITFNVQPSDAGATVVLKDADGAEVAPFSAGVYNRIPEGTYSYTVTAAGYEESSGTVAVSADTRETIYVSLVRIVPEDVPASETVLITVKVLSHDPDICNGRYTYLHSYDAYESILGDESYTVTVEKGKGTARDALVATLDHYGISYTEKSNGYFSMINGEEQMDHDSPNSGWMYLVNGEPAEVGASQYVFRSNATMIWYFTDDYTKDYGSDKWNNDPGTGGGSGEGTGTVISPSEPAGTQFDDVKDTDWYADAVKFVVGRGIFRGTDKGFEPDIPMTRAMLVTVLQRIAGGEAKGANPFSDVKDGEWYTDAVIWASENGIVYGRGNGFEPDASVTREEIAVMMYRFVKYLGKDASASKDLSGFADGADVSDFALEAMQWAVGAGLFKGDDTGRLNPGSDATRAEVAAVTQRLIQLIEK